MYVLRKLEQTKDLNALKDKINKIESTGRFFYPQKGFEISLPRLIVPRVGESFVCTGFFSSKVLSVFQKGTDQDTLNLQGYTGPVDLDWVDAEVLFCTLNSVYAIYKKVQ